MILGGISHCPLWGLCHSWNICMILQSIYSLITKTENDWPTFRKFDNLVNGLKKIRWIKSFCFVIQWIMQTRSTIRSPIIYGLIQYMQQNDFQQFDTYTITHASDITQLNDNFNWCAFHIWDRVKLNFSCLVRKSKDPALGHWSTK